MLIQCSTGFMAGWPGLVPVIKQERKEIDSCLLPGSMSHCDYTRDFRLACGFILLPVTSPRAQSLN